MESVTCPDCGKTYINYYVYRKHAKRKHETYFEPKKTGPKRVFMPEAPDPVRKEAMYKKSIKSGEKRNYKQRQLRLANQIIKHQNQSDDDYLHNS
jgi:hypothetical protein